MGRTACTEPQCLYTVALYLFSGDFLPTFRDNLSVPSAGFKNQDFATTRRVITRKFAILTTYWAEVLKRANSDVLDITWACVVIFILLCSRNIIFI